MFATRIVKYTAMTTATAMLTSLTAEYCRTRTKPETSDRVRPIAGDSTPGLGASEIAIAILLHTANPSAKKGKTGTRTPVPLSFHLCPTPLRRHDEARRHHGGLGYRNRHDDADDLAGAHGQGRGVIARQDHFVQTLGHVLGLAGHGHFAGRADDEERHVRDEVGGVRLAVKGHPQVEAGGLALAHPSRTFHFEVGVHGL